MPPKKAAVESTAATGRPRRGAATAVANDAPTKATPKKRGRPAAAKEVAEPPAKRGRGRPAKAAIEPEEEDDAPEEAPPADAPKKRGRPAKSVPAPALEPEVAEEEVSEPAKKRGRPAKKGASAPAVSEPSKKRGRGKAAPKPSIAEPVDEEAEDEEEVAEAVAEPPKKRGRGKAAPKPAAVEPDAEEVDEANEVAEEVAEPPKKRGRPGKKAAAAPAPAVSNEEPTPKKRGRPPKGGETTKISGDDEAAAEQLEDELIDEATKPEPSSKPEETADLTEVDAGKQYWLMKAEQEDRMETTKSGKEINTKFTIDDLRSKTEPEAWDAAKNMRAMRTGDLAFFYASQGKQGRKPGITGIMEIVSEAEPDPTVADPEAYGYVEKESMRDKWCVVRVEFRKKLSSPVTLAELQKFGQDSGVLSNMAVLKQTRLSVSKVTADEWNFIVDNLVDGYDDEDEAPDAEDKAPVATTNGHEAQIPDSNLPDGGPAAAAASDEPAIDQPTTDLPEGDAVTAEDPEHALPTVESELPSTDVPAPKAATSSVAPSTSRATSLAPPAGRSTSRARSRTPKLRAANAQPETGNMEAIQE